MGGRERKGSKELLNFEGGRPASSEVEKGNDGVVRESRTEKKEAGAVKKTSAVKTGRRAEKPSLRHC